MKAFPTVVHMLLEAVEANPEKEALVCLEERLNYREYLNCVLAFAEELSAHQVSGERVALVMGNSNDICIAMFAAHFARAQVVPMNPMYTEHELRPMFEDAEIKVVIYDINNRDCVEKLANEFDIKHKIFIDQENGRRLTVWKE